MLEALQGSSVQQLPTGDRRIGAYWYSAEERGRGVGMVYSRLEANYSVSGGAQPAWWLAGSCRSKLLGRSCTHRSLRQLGALHDASHDDVLQVLEHVLRGCLAHCMYAAGALPQDAGHLLTPRLARALLGPDRSMPKDVKTAALGLIFTVTSSTPAQSSEQQELHSIS